MPFRAFLGFLFCLAASGLALGQQPETTDLSGNWLITAGLFGTTIYERMDVAQSGKNVRGKYAGDKITSGETVGTALHLLATSDDVMLGAARFFVIDFAGSALCCLVSEQRSES